MPIAMRYGSNDYTRSGGASGGGGGITMSLLWTNPSPTSNFAAQTVSINLSEFQALKIKFITSPTGTMRAVQDVLVDGETYNCYLHNATTGTQYSYIRQVIATSTGVEFSTGYREQTAGAGYMIPLEIYGIKGIT